MVRMTRWLGRGAIFAIFVPLAGCGGGAPSVTSSMSEATVHGTVKYKGKPVDSGEISFDPTNISRKDAPIVSSKIGKDGTYTIKTLVGPNSVHVNLPAFNKSDPNVGMYGLRYEVPGGDSTLDVDPSVPAP